MPKYRFITYIAIGSIAGLIVGLAVGLEWVPLPTWLGVLLGLPGMLILLPASPLMVYAAMGGADSSPMVASGVALGWVLVGGLLGMWRHNARYPDRAKKGRRAVFAVLAVYAVMVVGEYGYVAHLGSGTADSALSLGEVAEYADLRFPEGSHIINGEYQRRNIHKVVWAQIEMPRSDIQRFLDDNGLTADDVFFIGPEIESVKPPDWWQPCSGQKETYYSKQTGMKESTKTSVRTDSQGKALVHLYWHRYTH